MSPFTPTQTSWSNKYLPRTLIRQSPPLRLVPAAAEPPVRPRLTPGAAPPPSSALPLPLHRRAAVLASGAAPPLAWDSHPRSSGELLHLLFLPVPRTLFRMGPRMDFLLAGPAGIGWDPAVQHGSGADPGGQGAETLVFVESDGDVQVGRPPFRPVEALTLDESEEGQDAASTGQDG
ncbi:hypothetical protein BS78_05G219500 [Paspalum vaginatum]|nr:hypothetical protein BS78_05G219500 [Paspalum vaginatum]KAJ1276506.1 hypothetical protein BS78_05G219500 [Paspalum vaginatum]KAJ1276507.1 hypothetical protein BS78_05G219500 [Paspalum vaginatum]KAJ1276508.1 hypothetical protein BS78_05G219500 [Paspalum vaginatum]KAJ1276509.1 hypothetical protein BS78_05G219500 [Paspalum vaginatum]